MTQDLVATIADQLANISATLATAESCTGGLVAHHLTGLPGSSTWFLGGVVAYSNFLKSTLLDVPDTMIEAHGAVSEEVARAMVSGLLDRTEATWAIGVTGIAGPGGGTEAKPVGLVYIGTGRMGDIQVRRYNFSGSRASIKDQSAAAALHQLLEMLPE
jgi:PncC family amidohydrolase